MKFIKKIFQISHIAFFIILALCLFIFRILDLWYDNALSRVFINPLVENFPISMSVIAIVALIFFVAKLEAKDDTEKKENELKSDMK